MSYSAKMGDLDGFGLDMIAMGSRRRAKAEEEKKALVNSEKYVEPGPRVLNGGMQTNDKLKAVAAAKIEKMYSTTPVRKRAVPTAASAQNKNAPKQQSATVEYASATRKLSTRTIPAVPEKKQPEVQRVQPQQPSSAPRQRRTKVYTAKKVSRSIQTRRDKNKNPVPIGAITAILIMTVLLLYFVVLYIQSYELKNGINDLKNELSEKHMTQNTWETKLDEKNPSLDKIEQFATQDGMIRKTPDKYISITPDGDVIEIYDNK